MSVEDKGAEMGRLGRQWPTYRTVWRWHFFAGAFCVPFVIFLSITGDIYLFKPLFVGAIDRPFEGLANISEHRLLSEQVQVVLDRYPKAKSLHVELPKEEQGATRVIVKDDVKQWRVFVHPKSLEVLAVRDEEAGLMRQIKQLHGQLKAGVWGSYLVELAASWTIIMILTGVVLWWPRNAKGVAGVLYPRWGKGARVWWRDVHSVIGVWVSLFAVFLIVTGLPWAKFWGSYFRTVREATGLASVSQEWTIGGKDVSKGGAEHADHAEHSEDRKGAGRAAGGSGGKRGGRPGTGAPVPKDLSGFDQAILIARREKLAYPVLLTPPKSPGLDWTVASEAQNRVLRRSIGFDASTGEIRNRDEFADKHWLDRVVSVGIAAHEGQLFGGFNQLLGVLTTLGLIGLSSSGVWMWWIRREAGGFGIPEPLQQTPLVLAVWLLVAFLGIAMPLFGISVAIVALLDWVLRRKGKGLDSGREGSMVNR